MKELEFWFEFGSNYSYLTVMRIEQEATRLGVRIIWKPFLLGPIFKDFGWSTSPFVLQKEKGRYMWTDMDRQCGKYGLAWNKPTTFPRAAILPMRVAVLGASKPWIGAFSRAVMMQNFVEDLDIAAEENVRAALGSIGLPATEIILAAQEDGNKAALRDQTSRARELGVFGAPTFFVGGEMFWGNDRLEDALAFAANR
jgi:2-hydroxychromene-2-carboxylate isomerase